MRQSRSTHTYRTHLVDDFSVGAGRVTFFRPPPLLGVLSWIQVRCERFRCRSQWGDVYLFQDPFCQLFSGLADLPEAPPGWIASSEKKNARNKASSTSLTGIENSLLITTQVMKSTATRPGSHIHI